jgi:hypothetical protein
MGTSISFFVFRRRIFVWAARFVNIRAFKVASEANRFEMTLPPIGVTIKASPILTMVCFALSAV